MSSPRETIFSDRQKRLFAALRNQGLEALVLNPGPSLFYLTGLRFHLSERPVVAIFAMEATPVMVLPAFEAGKLQDLPFAARTFHYGEDPETWQAVFHQAVQAADIDGRPAGLEPRQMRILELRLLEGAAPETEFQPAEDSLAILRMRKDATEISAMRKAVEIAQRALEETLPLIRRGITERQLANELVIQLLRFDSENELPFFPIVAAGPNSANPHASPSERQLTTGDLLILDWGASVDGYASDLTRTFSLGEPDEELAQVAQVVLEANAAARELAGPGVPAEKVDQAARDVIDGAGFGKFFIHRTGHGLGLESHEAPYIRSGNPQLLEEGMVFTIEPGVYLPGRGGVRIEDDVVVTESGSESLSDRPRELIVI